MSATTTLGPPPDVGTFQGDRTWHAAVRLLFFEIGLVPDDEDAIWAPRSRERCRCTARDGNGHDRFSSDDDMISCHRKPRQKPFVKRSNAGRGQARPRRAAKTAFASVSCTSGVCRATRTSGTYALASRLLSRAFDVQASTAKPVIKSSKNRIIVGLWHTCLRCLLSSGPCALLPFLQDTVAVQIAAPSGTVVARNAEGKCGAGGVERCAEIAAEPELALTHSGERHERERAR